MPTVTLNKCPGVMPDVLTVPLEPTNCTLIDEVHADCQKLADLAEDSPRIQAIDLSGEMLRNSARAVGYVCNLTDYADFWRRLAFKLLRESGRSFIVTYAPFKSFDFPAIDPRDNPTLEDRIEAAPQIATSKAA